MLRMRSIGSDPQLDPQRCYQAMRARDPRFDGVFFVGVATTRIYCRPVCTVRLPMLERCSFYRSAPSAERAGFRPCLRCRPELAPGHAKVDAVKRLAHRAAERIRSGDLQSGGLESLAAELGSSSRQLRRAIESEFGVGPVALARTYRLLMAKQLLTDTSLRMVDVAVASGFSSVRRFNAAFREQYRLNPSELRRHRGGIEEPGIVLRLGYRPPFAWRELVDFLVGRGSPHSERLVDGVYVRTLTVRDTSGWIAATHDADRCQVQVEVAPELLESLIPLQKLLRSLFDLDAHPSVICAHLRKDPQLAPRVDRCPGLRVPGAVNGFELALRSVVGQQISVKAASTVYSRMVERFGDPIETPYPGLDRVGPSAVRMAELSLPELGEVGLTQQRASTIRGVARAIVDGKVDFERAEPSELASHLLELPGIGPWTASYIAMRGLGDPDALPLADRGLLRGLELQRPAELEARAVAWSPWRAYAAVHIWNDSTGGG